MTAYRMTAKEWVEPIDGAVAEVFETMLGRRCIVVDAMGMPGPEIAAEIRFSGSLEGRCLIEVSMAAATLLVEALLGPGEGDAMIEDAVGELCNMIAGGWKRRLGERAAVCSLSVPAVVRGMERARGNEFVLSARRAYGLSGEVLEVEVALERGDSRAGLSSPVCAT